ncbi:hypothetical protein ACWEPL_12340 [Nonomuraea sp. NPDC004186]
MVLLSGIGTSSKVGELAGMPIRRAAATRWRRPARTVAVLIACPRVRRRSVVAWWGRVVTVDGFWSLAWVFSRGVGGQRQALSI